jgi:hypothetical protein
MGRKEQSHLFSFDYQENAVFASLLGGQYPHVLNIGAVLIRAEKSNFQKSRVKTLNFQISMES